MHHPHTSSSLQRPATTREQTPSGQRGARAYTGIGSRRTPTPIRELMSAVAARLAVDGWTLRSGGDAGADQAFQAGAAQARGAIELYLPWPTFQSANLDRLGPVTVASSARPRPRPRSPRAGTPPGTHSRQLLVACTPGTATRSST